MLFKYKEGVKALTEFTSKEQNGENLQYEGIFFRLMFSFSRSFYMQVREFKKKFNSRLEIRHSELVQDATVIYKRFLADSAEELVNLPGGITKKCKKSFAGGVRPSLSLSLALPDSLLTSTCSYIPGGSSRCGQPVGVRRSVQLRLQAHGHRHYHSLPPGARVQVAGREDREARRQAGDQTRQRGGPLIDASIFCAFAVSSVFHRLRYRFSLLLIHL